jgi:dTDP-4-amino-4,6-dideoxygalactose transaminase
MNIPFVDIKIQFESIKSELLDAVTHSIISGNYILGKEVEEFEKKFADYIGCKHAVGVASGLDALFLSLKSYDVKSGDEVILPANTFIATALAVSNSGATPVFVDCGLDYNIDSSKIEDRITQHTKGIIPVHLTGYPCDMDAILSIAKEYNLFVIEDAAQAHGATYNKKKCGSIGNVGCFSFYPSKNLGVMGDGGMIVTNDLEFANRIKCLRSYGQMIKYEHIMLGFNSRLDTIQAAGVTIKLKYIDEWNNNRIKNAEFYNELLKGLKGLHLPISECGRTHIYHLYMVLCDKRDSLRAFLKQKNIETGIHYPIPIHLQKCYNYLNYKQGDFPISENLSKQLLSLPMYPELRREQIQYVCDCIKEFYHLANSQK